MRVPMEAWMPSSSSSSRRRACSADSPASIFPPGNSHLRPMGAPALRWQMRTSSPRRMSAAATKRSVLFSLPFWGVSPIFPYSLDAGRRGSVLNPAQAGLGSTENLGIKRSGDRLQPLHQSRGRRVEKLIGNAENTMVADGLRLRPSGAGGEFFQRHAVAGSAPGGDDDVWVCLSNSFRRGDGPWLSQKDAACDLDQFPDPELRVNERFAPFFAVDEWLLRSPCTEFPDILYGGSHAGD